MKLFVQNQRVNKCQNWDLNPDLLALNPLFFIQKAKASASSHIVNKSKVVFFLYIYRDYNARLVVMGFSKISAI